MATITIEVPGGIGPATQCPYCSKCYEADDPPSRCKRCTSPMDVEKSHEFNLKHRMPARE